MDSHLPRLSEATLGQAKLGVAVPGYRRSKKATHWLHIGVGAFHRSHQQALASRLLEAGHKAWGIHGGTLRPDDVRLCQDLAAQDGLYTLIERDGASQRASIVGSLADVCMVGGSPDPTYQLAEPEVSFVTLTVTEGGYCVDPATGELELDHPDVVADLEQQDEPTGLYGTLAAGLRFRCEFEEGGVTLASCDNIAGNGDMLRRALLAFLAEKDATLSDWIDEFVAFPNSMVDRITPQATAGDVAAAAELTGLHDARPVVCEPFWQWVIEDKFAPARPRPPLEEAGALVVADAKPYEKLKIWLLNGSHQALAQTAALAAVGDYVHQAMADDDVRGFVASYLDEVAPLLDPVPGIELRQYKRTLLDRYANAGVRDTVARIAACGSDRLPRFVVPPLLAARSARAPCARMCLVVAAWCARVAHGIKDADRPGAPANPKLRQLAAAVADKPADFICGGGLFPPQAALDPELAQALAAQAQTIRQRGIRAALADLPLAD